MVASEHAGERMRFGRQLRSARLTRGLTRGALADLSGVHYNTLTRLELGQGRPSDEVLIRLATALELSAAMMDEWL
jgi:transcriptional regulator with XRE-family HTH domain